MNFLADKQKLYKEIQKNLNVGMANIFSQREEKAKLENEIKLLSGQIKALNNEVKSLESRYNKYKTGISGFISKRQEIRKYVKESMEYLQSYQQSIKPYINAIIKFYKVKGKTPPSLLLDFKPKSILYTQKEWKKITNQS